MSKYQNRINKLITKTHNFISHSNHCLVRDYFKALFEGFPKSEDFEEKLKEFEELEKRCLSTNDQLAMKKLNEIVSRRDVFAYKYLYEFAKRMCDKYPNGIWVTKPLTNKFLITIKAARRYLNENPHKDFNSS